MIDFIAYLETLKPEDWNKMATPKWTVKDVVAHMVAWEKRDAEVIKVFWETKKREPWMSTRAEWDEFNRKEVERYKNYTPQQLLDEWKMWQKKVAEEINKIGYENIRSRPDLFDWILEDEGHYTLNEGGSHYEHHYEQIRKVVEYTDLNIPFYPQKWDLSQWKNLGFQSYEDAAYWEKSSCGVLCLKMAVDAFLMKEGKPLSPSISEYIQQGVAIGAYTDAVGWNHAGLARLAEHFGMRATAHRRFNAQDISKALSRNCLCIASVRWAFQPIKRLKERLLFWRKVAGHLVLVVGTREDSGKLMGFYVNHTSTLAEYNWNHKFIPIAEFNRGFSERGVVIGVK